MLLLLVVIITSMIIKRLWVFCCFLQFLLQKHFLFHNQRSAAPLSPIDGRGHKNQIRSEQFLNQRKRNGCSFIYDQQFSLAQFHSISWMDVLFRSKWGSAAMLPSFLLIINNYRTRRRGSGLIYLDRLPMFFEDVHPHYSFVELWI